MTPAVDDTASLPDGYGEAMAWLDGLTAVLIAALVVVSVVTAAGWWMARRQAGHYRAEMMRLSAARSRDDRRCACGRYPMMSHFQLTDGWGAHEPLGCVEADR